VYGGGADTLIAGRDSRGFAAALQLHPVTQWVGGMPLASAAVGTVAISPTHRKRRLGNALMAAGLRAAFERGDVASSLYPFRTSFYQKLGYGEGGIGYQYQIAPSQLRGSEERAAVEVLESDAQRSEALSYYNAWARTQTGQFERSPRVWSEFVGIHDRGLFGYRGPDGTLQGYAIVTYRVDGARSDRHMEVEELVWSTPRARQGLHGWLASLDDQWERILVRALPGDRLRDWLKDARLRPGSVPMWGYSAPTATLHTGAMFRLLNISAAFDGRSASTDAPMSIAVEVADDQLQENAGAWRLACDGGRTSLTRGGSSAAHATLRTDISTLSRLYLNSISCSSAFAAGLLECDRPEVLPLLDAALRLPEPWTFDRF
jgi:predicted acetyltransferase